MFFFLFGDVFFLSYNILSRVIDSTNKCGKATEETFVCVWEGKRQIMPFGFGRSYQLPIECEKTYQAAITI